MKPGYLALLHESCGRLAPIHSEYATLPVQEAFNWSSCLADALFSRLYLVVFRSVRREGVDLELLRTYDDRAYAEAAQKGGLLRYFKGEINDRRECVSFCLWESREQALDASNGSSHRAAAEISARLYEHYVLERYELRKSAKGVAFRRVDGSLQSGERRDAGYSSARSPV